MALQAESQMNTGLKVFVPLVHAARAGGIARSLIRGGHTMWMNAPGSAALTKFDVAMPQEQARAAFGQNVYCYEDEQILFDPPDVIIVGSESLEDDIFYLHERLSLVKPIVICCISGNYQSNFDWPAYRGSICSDEPSRALSRYNDVPTLRYYELFDASQFPYKPWQPGLPIVLPVFVKFMRKRFPFSANFCDECIVKFKQVFGEKIRIRVYDDAPLSEAWAAMQTAPAVLAIKDQEGYGWAMLEALSIGRPIIYQSGLLRGMEFHKWTEPNISGIAFNTPDDLAEIATDISENILKWQILQERTATIFRERYDGSVTADNLNIFLELLMRLETMRWHPGRPRLEVRERAAPYHPSLDPMTRQDWERITKTRPRKVAARWISVEMMGEEAFGIGWDVGPDSATSLGASMLDLSHLHLEPGAMLSIQHHRAKPVNLTFMKGTGEVLVTLSLPCGKSRVPIPSELGLEKLQLLGECWSPATEFGSGDTRDLSFNLMGICYAND